MRRQSKGKLRPGSGHEGPDGEQNYSSTLSLTSALDVGVWLTPRPSRFTPKENTRYPLRRRLGGPHGRSGPVRNFSPPPVFDPRTVQSVASRYANWTISALPEVVLHCKEILNKTHTQGITEYRESLYTIPPPQTPQSLTASKKTQPDNVHDNSAFQNHVALWLITTGGPFHLEPPSSMTSSFIPGSMQHPLGPLEFSHVTRHDQNMCGTHQRLNVRNTPKTACAHTPKTGCAEHTKDSMCGTHQRLHVRNTPTTECAEHTKDWMCGTHQRLNVRTHQRLDVRNIPKTGCAEHTKDWMCGTHQRLDVRTHQRLDVRNTPKTACAEYT
jgi:hypothetical protein